MKILILTSSLYGTASHHFNYLISNNKFTIDHVVISKGELNQKKKYFYNKFKKAFKIGILGALNGIRMRKWFGRDVDKLLNNKNLAELCIHHNIPFTIVSKINSDETMNLFMKINPDLGVSLGNGFISKKIFNTPRFGMINIHHEILPNYQNAQSIIWQLFNKSRNTGFTIHKIDSKIDTGEIIYQETVPIIFRKTLSKTITITSIELLKKSALGLIKVLENFEHYHNNSIKQEGGYSYTTPSIKEFYIIYKNFKILGKANQL